MGDEVALAADDECQSTGCSLNALQLRGAPLDAADVTLEASYAGGWSWGGDKVWGHGRGIESINAGNVGYYNAGMSTARARCGGPSCALIMNPPAHRSVNKAHIHAVHYQSYGG